MVFDICVRVRDIGEVFGSYYKTSRNSVYLRNAMINRSSSATVAMLKIEKKFIASVSRMATPSFESFTNEQLRVIVALKAPAYTENAKKILAQRASQDPGRACEKNPSSELGLSKVSPTNTIAKDKPQPAAKPKKSRKEWDQFEANERLFGVKPEFNINDYTTGIDRSAPGYKELEEKSSKIAREILSQSTVDVHRLEERGAQRATADASDDKMYSAVDLEDRWAEPHIDEEVATKLATCPVLSQKASILRELEEVEKTINDSKGVSGGWTGLVIQILSKKKNLIEKLQALDEEAKRARESPVSSSPEAVEKKESAETHSQSSRKHNSKSRESSRKSESATSFEMTFAPGVKVNLDENSKSASSKNSKNQRSANKKQQDASKTVQSETKPQKQVVIGGEALEYPSGQECIEAIKHSFRRKRSDEELKPWGTGPTIEDIYSVHMNPLESFEMPPEKINDIVKAAQRDAEVIFKKYK